MGFDGYTGVNSNAVVNITEAAGDLTAFKNFIDPGEKSEDGKFLADTHNITMFLQFKFLMEL
jgi:hypothetical protein